MSAPREMLAREHAGLAVSRGEVASAQVCWKAMEERGSRVQAAVQVNNQRLSGDGGDMVGADGRRAARRSVCVI